MPTNGTRSMPRRRPAAKGKRNRAQKVQGTETTGPDPKPRGPRIGRIRLYDFGDLDHRCRAPAQIKAIRDSVYADLGGVDGLSTLERISVDHVSIMSAMAADLGARWAAGEKVDVQAIATLVNTFNRSAAALGWRRRAKDVSPDLDAFDVVHGNDVDADELEAAE